MSRKHGVERLVAVCPIEHELFWTEDNHTPLQLRDEAQQKALESFDKLTILNSNLVFGKDSYLVHYLTQCAAAGRVNKSVGGSKSFQYKPVHQGDLANAVEAALKNTSDVKGKKFSVNGTQSTSLNNLLHLVEGSVGKQEGSTKLVGSFLGLGLSDFVEEFFTGITHDKNMARMADYLEQNQTNLEEGSPDFHKTLGLSQETQL